VTLNATSLEMEFQEYYALTDVLMCRTFQQIALPRSKICSELEPFVGSHLYREAQGNGNI
jgi:hypothetical protein